MKNKMDISGDIFPQRIITPLEPKRVHSVAPGLEGLAALAPAACESAPEVAYSDLAEPEIAFCGVGGNALELGVPESVELPAEVGDDGASGEFVGDGVSVTNELPEMVTCEMFPCDGEIPDEWLRPISVVDQPEDHLVNLFEGEGEPVDEEGVPYELESGFEICVLSIPEEFPAEVDPSELLARYEEFLSQDPTWRLGLAEGQDDCFCEKVTTASAYFEKLEFGTPGEANAFDQWFASNFGAAGGGGGEEGVDCGDGQPDYADGSWLFDPKGLLVRYEDFLRENPDWGTLDPDTMESQVVTPSRYFSELEFNTPSRAEAFDNWYKVFYTQQGGGDIFGEIWRGEIKIPGGLESESASRDFGLSEGRVAGGVINEGESVDASGGEALYSGLVQDEAEGANSGNLASRGHFSTAPDTAVGGKEAPISGGGVGETVLAEEVVENNNSNFPSNDQVLFGRLLALREIHFDGSAGDEPSGVTDEGVRVQILDFATGEAARVEQDQRECLPDLKNGSQSSDLKTVSEDRLIIDSQVAGRSSVGPGNADSTTITAASGMVLGTIMHGSARSSGQSLEKTGERKSD
jgi:hypothetical protein